MAGPGPHRPLASIGILFKSISAIEDAAYLTVAPPMCARGRLYISTRPMCVVALLDLSIENRGRSPDE